tara:strand:- start:719 stop:1081 length:363 start_codon:yes stop_codon:yes gene_type:complete
MKYIIILLTSLFLVSNAYAEESKKYVYVVYSDLTPGYSNRIGDNNINVVWGYESKEECEKELMEGFQRRSKRSKGEEDLNLQDAFRITTDKWGHVTLIMDFDDRTVYNVCLPLTPAWKSR